MPKYKKYKNQIVKFNRKFRVKKIIFIFINLAWLTVFTLKVHAGAPVANVTATVNSNGTVTLNWNQFSEDFSYPHYHEEEDYVYEFVELSLEISNTAGEHEYITLSIDHNDYDGKTNHLLNNLNLNLQYTVRLRINYYVWDNQPPWDVTNKWISGTSAQFGGVVLPVNKKVTYIHTDTLGSPVAESPENP